MQKQNLSIEDTVKELGLSYIWSHRKVPYIKLGGKKFTRLDSVNLICDEGVE